MDEARNQVSLNRRLKMRSCRHLGAFTPSPPWFWQPHAQFQPPLNCPFSRDLQPRSLDAARWTHCALCRAGRVGVATLNRARSKTVDWPPPNVSLTNPVEVGHAGRVAKVSTQVLNVPSLRNSPSPFYLLSLPWLHLPSSPGARAVHQSGRCLFQYDAVHEDQHSPV